MKNRAGFRLKEDLGLAEDVAFHEEEGDEGEWAWAVVSHLTKRMLFQASVYVHDNEFDALRQKVIRYLRDYGAGELNHGILLRYLHIDSDTFRRVIDTLVQSELIDAIPLVKGGMRYKLR